MREAPSMRVAVLVGVREREGVLVLVAVAVRAESPQHGGSAFAIWSASAWWWASGLAWG